MAEKGLTGSFSLLTARGADKLAGYTDSKVAHVAQLAEHILGKDEVTSSNLVMGSRFTAL